MVKYSNQLPSLVSTITVWLTLEKSCEKKALVVCNKISAFCVSGIFDTDLEELEELLDEMKTV